MAQWYAYIDGTQYGPIEDEDVRQWIFERRIAGEDYLWTDGMDDWAQAGTVLAFSTDFARPEAAPAAGGVWRRPHRGGGVLALGIIGLVLSFACWLVAICGIIAWSMGNADLREMRAGRMDPSGRGLTVAGKVCGIIATILALVQVGLWVLWIVGALAAF